MNDERLFERLATHAGPADVDPGFEDRLYALLQREMGRTGRSSRRALLLVAALLLTLVIGGAALVGSGIVELPMLPDSSATHLAYGLDGDIYLADSDGGNPVRVADGLPPDGAPGCGKLGVEGSMWSPDGRYVAYRSDHWGDLVDPPCPGTVHLRDAAGQPVVSFPGTGWLVSWSPDSTRVATWVDLYQTIGIYGIDGVRQALLTVPTGCWDGGDFDPMWSPDGRSVVVSGCEVPVDGGTPRRLPGNDPRSLGWRYWPSPDGTRFAYVTLTEDYSDPSRTASIVIAEADGTELRVLPYRDSLEDGTVDAVLLGSLVWSPSGDRVAFTWAPLDINGATVESAFELRVVDVSSGTVRTLAAESGIAPLAFSPDGDRILFATHGANDVGTGLWSVNADGSDVQLLVEGTGWGDWQPPPPGS